MSEKFTVESVGQTWSNLRLRAKTGHLVRVRITDPRSLHSILNDTCQYLMQDRNSIPLTWTSMYSKEWIGWALRKERLPNGLPNFWAMVGRWKMPGTFIKSIQCVNRANLPPNTVFYRNTVIYKGQSWKLNGRLLVFQGDGNLVLYNKDMRAIWHSKTNGKGDRVIFQSDGNLVIYNSANQAVFHTGTNGRGHRFDFQPDGNLVIYDFNFKPVWLSHTAYK